MMEKESFITIKLSIHSITTFQNISFMINLHKIMKSKIKNNPYISYFDLIIPYLQLILTN